MVANDEAMRKAGKLSIQEIQCLGSLLYTARGRVVDPARMKWCRDILHKKEGMFSDFRGTLELVVLTKMSLADDPEHYLDGLVGVHEQVVAGKKVRLVQHALAAMVIHDLCPAGQVGQVVEETKRLYEAVREAHPFITDSSDMAFIALMVMSGKSPTTAAEDAEECFQLLRERYRIGADAAQSAAQVLSLSAKAPDDKVARFLSLYDALKAAKHHTDKGKAMSVLATFADVDASQDEIVAAIGEVDKWLKPHRGYGAFGVGGNFRRMIAAALVSQEYRGGGADGAADAGVSSAIVQLAIEELVVLFVLLMMSTTTVVTATN